MRWPNRRDDAQEAAPDLVGPHLADDAVHAIAGRVHKDVDSAVERIPDLVGDGTCAITGDNLRVRPSILTLSGCSRNVASKIRLVISSFGPDEIA